MSSIGVAVVGVGAWGQNLLRVFSSLEAARVVAVSDTDPERLAAAKDAPEARRCASLAEALRDPAVDAVVIATPPALHTAHSLEALDAGKHVFVEKPMTLSTRDALLVEERALRARRKVMVGHILRYHPGFVRLLELVREGALGDLEHVRCERLGAAGVPDAESAWYSLAPHDVSAMRALFGGDPLSLHATTADRLTGTEAMVGGALTFSGGGVGTLLVAPRASRKRRRILAGGSRRTAVFDDVEFPGEIRIFDGVLPSVPDDWPAPGLEYVAEPVSREEPLLREARHFIAGIGGATILTDAAEGRAVVTALEAGMRSMRRGGEPIDVGALPPVISSRAPS